jgi:hypothetical protein
MREISPFQPTGNPLSKFAHGRKSVGDEPMIPKKINVGSPKVEKATSLAIWSPPGSPKVKPPAKVLRL